MLTGDETGAGNRHGAEAGWRSWLAAETSLSPGLQESYRRTLEGFDAFCRQRATRAGGPVGLTVALAREYVELQRLERAPGSVAGSEQSFSTILLLPCIAL